MNDIKTVETDQRPVLPFSQRAGVFIGSLGAAGVVDLVMHGGFPGIVLGGTGAFLLAKHSPAFADYLRKHNLPAPSLAQREPGTYSFLDRLQGKHLSEEQPPVVSGEPKEARPLVREPASALDFDAPSEIEPLTLLSDKPLYFSTVLKTFKPSLDRIYLGTLPNGKIITTSARDLCHTALAGATRGGKSHLIRMLMAQLCAAGAHVYLLNPHYIRYDLETVDPYGRPCPEDWTPFEPYLKNNPREMIPVEKKYRVIEHYLREAFALVGKRLEIKGESQQRLGAPHFFFIDELPAIVDEIREAPTYLKRILREGAKVGVFVVNASQDMQVKTILKDVGGGIRECYRTAFDVGSEPATQTALGLPVMRGLGKGKASLRCDAVLSLPRVPYVDNESLYRLLGPSTYIPADERAEDDLVAGLMASSGGREREERHTDPLPAATSPRYHDHAVGRAAQSQRARARAERLRATPVAVESANAAREQAENAISVQEAHKAWQAGNTSVRRLAAALSTTNYQAEKLIERMASRGLIETKSRTVITD